MKNSGEKSGDEPPKKGKKGKKQLEKTSAKFVEDGDEVILEVTGNQSVEFCNESEIKEYQFEEDGEVTEDNQSEDGSESNEIITFPNKEKEEMSKRESRNNNAIMDQAGATKHRRTYYEESDVEILPKTMDQLQRE